MHSRATDPLTPLARFYVTVAPNIEFKTLRWNLKYVLIVSHLTPSRINYGEG